MNHGRNNGQGFIISMWRMKQGGGMRVVDHVSAIFY